MTDTRATRNTPLIVSAALALLGVALIVVSVMYFTKNAHQLPPFFPGHEGAKGVTHHHTKHAIAALVVGLLAFVGAWMTSGRRTRS